MSLTAKEKEQLIALIEKDKPIPSGYRHKLFGEEGVEYVERTGVYRLEYRGKMREQEILAGTPSAPLQQVRCFNSDNSFEDGWKNRMIYGDNLLALKAIYDDQRGENRLGTKGKIKLIYIDPPFATKQDFMKDREKAYRDKVIGAQFIEFLRKRLVLMREILADDGSIYVHLDWKKGHYIKAIMDEIFGEHNFQNEIVWKRTPFAGSSKARSTKFPINHDAVYFYTKSGEYFFQHQYSDYSSEYKARFKYKDDIGFYRKTLLKTYSEETKQKLIRENRFIPPTKPGSYPSYKQYLHESKGKQLEDIWDDVNLPNPMADERLGYPTQKPEKLLQRIISASSDAGDIVLDAFSGSGTTIATAEKMNRRWVAMDCGKLGVYTAQKRLLHLVTQIGSVDIPDLREYQRVTDFTEHSKSDTRALWMIYEKARKGDLVITDAMLNALAEFHDQYIAPTTGKRKNNNQGEEVSLICPEKKLQLQKLKLSDDMEGLKAGEKAIRIGRITFVISFIQPKEKTPESVSLKAREFELLNAGIYDNDQIKSLSWDQYKPFVMQLFGARSDEHKLHAQPVDGYIGADRVVVWNYPDYPDWVLDYGYVESLHQSLNGRAGDRLYVIAPVTAMEFMEDEIRHGDTLYTFLKVPVSILLRLMEADDPGGAIKQPLSEDAVNEVIDAIGFDFVSQPLVEYGLECVEPLNEDLFSKGKRDYLLSISEFRSNTLATDPEDYPNLATLSMVLVDYDYNGDIFNLGDVFWAEELISAELERLDVEATGHDNRADECVRLDLRLTNVSDEKAQQPEGCGKQMMVIFVDRYGNEKKVVVCPEEFTCL